MYPLWAQSLGSTRATREAAYTALFNLLKGIPLPNSVSPTGRFVTTGRALQDWDDVPHGNQPAMYLHQLPQRASQPNISLVQWQWHAACWVYYRTDNINNPNSGVYPDTVVNQILDAIELALQPAPPEERQTLGLAVPNAPGTTGVIHTWIDGDVVWDSGLTNNQAVIVIPITILVGN